ncbi:hypothetical protein PINS_up016564 [Pythium insidiosum]|nr:hypothetical protein PINS_up016564 [Pythium insidiosum]
MAMFAVDPVSGNTLGFAPSNLLAPRDAFDLFDEDGTGQIDELEFAVRRVEPATPFLPTYGMVV